MFRIYIIVACLFGQALSAQSFFENKQLTVTRMAADTRFTIDGKIDELFWHNLDSIDDFHQVRPDEYKEPSERTEVKIAYTKDYLLLAAKIYESNPSLIEANQLIQGKNYDFDDRFYLTLDTFNNQRAGYFFQLNPNGIRMEGLIDEKILHDDWSTIWQGQAQLTQEGWAVEMAIPFKSLSFQPNASQWGLNFGRVIARKNEIIAWSSGGADNWELSPTVFGKATGISAIDQGLGIDLKFSATSTWSDNANVDSGFEPSVDVFYKPSPSLNIAATFNTDFSAAEADLRVINSSRFSLFFPEKRDFFLQDVDIFEFGNIEDNGRPFFSRTIGLNESGQAIDLNIGTKITGRGERINYGLLAIEQENNNREKQRLYVARATVNVLKQSKIGFISTYGDPINGKSNPLIGFDFNYQNNNFLDAKIIDGGLWYQRTGQSSENNNQAYGATFNYPNDDASFYFSTTKIEEGFNPSLGFVNRSGIHETILQGGFQKRFDSDWLLNYYPWLYLRYVSDTQSRLLSKELYIYPLAFRTKKGDYIELAHQVNTEVLNSPFQLFSQLEVNLGRYDYNASHIRFSSAETRAVSVDLFYKVGGFFNGHQQEYDYKVNWRPNRNLFFQVNINRLNIELPAGNISTKLYNLSQEIAFNSKWSWLGVMQFDNLSNSVGVNSRLQWTPDAFSELSVSYNSTNYRSQENFGFLDENILVVKYSKTLRF